MKVRKLSLFPEVWDEWVVGQFKKIFTQSRKGAKSLSL